MKRRNAECGKLRRPIKRTKITEGIYGSSVVYLKFLALWGLVLAADHLLEFRFEFLWPFWLLLRSVYDSFKYQGLAFSLLFVCVAATSDMVCFFFIPIHWLFFLASTYVWVQYVWHTEKGVCLPTVVLCVLFVYIEAAVRMKDLKQPPFHMDLCRPFAAHCIGYPVVTFGFGFKSYVTYRMRQRRQREIAKENEFYMQLLQQALPPRPEPASMPSAVTIISTLPDKSNRVVCITPNDPDGKLPNGIVVNGIQITPPLPNGLVAGSKSNQRKNPDRGLDKDKNDSNHAGKSSHAHTNGSVPRPDEKKLTVNGVASKPVDRVDERKSPLNGSVSKSEEKKTLANGGVQRWDEKKSGSGALFQHDVDCERNSTCNDDSSESSSKGSCRSQYPKNGIKTLEPSSYCLKDKKNPRSSRESQEPAASTSVKEDSIILRLESDIKRLKSDLQSSKQTEQELRVQIDNRVSSERAARTEVAQLQGLNDDLSGRVQGLVSARQTDKQNLAALEKRLAEERRIRANCEAILASERKNKRQQEETALQAMASAMNKGECTENCKMRRRELENEIKALRREAKCKDDRLARAELEMQSLAQYKDAQNDTEILMSALSAMQDKNSHLENGLKAETRIKLDLFSALGEAKRQLEIRENLIRSQDKELEELKGKMAQVLAVMPSESFCPSPPTPLLQATSKFRCFSTVDDDYATMNNLRSLTESPASTLDPNATVYTPKGSSSSLVASTEA